MGPSRPRSGGCETSQIAVGWEGNVSDRAVGDGALAQSVTVTDESQSPGPLAGLRVLDTSAVIAGPNCARYLADFGADVIKVEKPQGDSLRNMAWRDPRDGAGIWWKLANRNKRTVVLDLKIEDDRDVLLRLVDDADVFVENSRPGTLERLGLGPDVLLARNSKLVIVRVTGFGQDGPYASRPGFASIAEGMSGLAAISGEPDGPPMLPAIALTDEVTGIAAAFATMVALRSGVGQVVDVNLLETLLHIMGPLPSVYAITGEQQPRLGSGLPYSVPRGTYQCRDGRWVVISSSSDSVAARVLDILGLADDARFATFAGRSEHRDELEAAMRAFCAAHAHSEVIDVFTAASAAIGPVMDMADIAADPHFQQREAMTDVAGTPMQNLIARLSATPGRLRWPGRSLDADGADIREHGWRDR
jgi:crotonobetainyl-CoA:carnitine CoA-transferase CaiB-like acyl-CoA transferase